MSTSPQVVPARTRDIQGRTRIWKRIARTYTRLCFTAVALGALLWFTSSPHARQLHDTTSANLGAQLMTGGFIAFLAFLFLAGCFFYIRALLRSIDQAMKPIPTPQQIAVDFQSTYGRPPTWEEVNAIQQILTRQRNEAAFGAAALIGGLWLGSHLVGGTHLHNGPR